MKSRVRVPTNCDNDDDENGNDTMKYTFARGNGKAGRTYWVSLYCGGQLRSGFLDTSGYDSFQLAYSIRPGLVSNT